MASALAISTLTFVAVKSALVASAVATRCGSRNTSHHGPPAASNPRPKSWATLSAALLVDAADHLLSSISRTSNGHSDRCTRCTAAKCLARFRNPGARSEVSSATSAALRTIRMKLSSYPISRA